MHVRRARPQPTLLDINYTILQSFVMPAWLCLTATALAGETSATEETKAPEPRFKISGWIDSGITLNPAAPDDNQNFGRFFDDRSNEPVMNQATLTLNGPSRRNPVSSIGGLSSNCCLERMRVTFTR